MGLRHAVECKGARFMEPPDSPVFFCLSFFSACSFCSLRALQNSFTLHPLGHEFYELLDCFSLVRRVEGVGDARPDEFAF